MHRSITLKRALPVFKQERALLCVVPPTASTMSGMVGAVVLARALDDPALSEEIMDATRRELLTSAG